jgi:hypothetical protein
MSERYGVWVAKILSQGKRFRNARHAQRYCGPRRPGE